MPDKDGYPTDEELQKIEEWPLSDGYTEFFSFIRGCWWTPQWGWREEDAMDDLFGRPVKRYTISTGGWSGNEEIIEAMRSNRFLWLFTWVQSRRGGHYIFEVKQITTTVDAEKEKG